MAHEPTSGRDNGTITPTAALSAMPYIPEESIAALTYFYRNLGNKTWGNYGFYDAFNVHESWYGDSYLAIDQGPIICMIENYRSQLLWNKFMANPEVQPMLDAIGFVTDPNDIENPIETSIQSLSCYPNPTGENLQIEFSIERGENVSLEIFNLQGGVVMIIEKDKYFSSGLHKVGANIANISSGIYFVKLQSGNYKLIKKILIK
jgi:hypothetical protein